MEMINKMEASRRASLEIVDIHIVIGISTISKEALLDAVALSRIEILETLLPAVLYSSNCGCLGFMAYQPL